VAAGGTRYLARAHPLRSAAGRVIGGYVVLRARDVEYAAFEAQRRATLVAGGVGLLAALLVSSAIARQVTRPLAALADAARRAAGGDYSASFAVGGGRDEVGVVAAALHTLLDELRAKQVLVGSRACRAGAGAERTERAVVPGRGRRRGPALAAEPTLRFPRDGGDEGARTPGSAGRARDRRARRARTGARGPDTPAGRRRSAGRARGPRRASTAADVRRAAEALRRTALRRPAYLWRR
jgi:HAMP domain-containing protein